MPVRVGVDGQDGGGGLGGGRRRLLQRQAAAALLGLLVMVVAADCSKHATLIDRNALSGGSQGTKGSTSSVIPEGSVQSTTARGIRGASGGLLQGSLSRARAEGQVLPFPEEAAFSQQPGDYKEEVDGGYDEDEEQEEQDEREERLVRRIANRRAGGVGDDKDGRAAGGKSRSGHIHGDGSRGDRKERCDSSTVRRRDTEDGGRDGNSKGSNSKSTANRSKRSGNSGGRKSIGYRDGAYQGGGRGPSGRGGRRENNRTREKRLLDEILGNNGYDRKIRPSSANRTDQDADYTRVMINLMIRSINKIDDYNMEFGIQMTFREQWNDDRLQYSDDGGKIKYLTLTETDKIWMPDLFFKNEKTGHFHEIILPNTYIRIFPNGDVLYSIRISLTLSCPMNLELYPLDTQTCELLMASYGWTTEDLVFKWKKDDPVQVTVLHLPRFTMEDYRPGSCDSKTNTGSYSCLRVDLIFKREFSYYLIQYYIPCCMLVMVSWVSFWLDQHAVPARVSLGVTTLLTMSTQNAGINQSLPPVSYTKAIDVWTGVCLTFVFGALLEFALVNYASRSDFQRDQQLMRQRWETDSQLTLFDMQVQQQQLQQQRARYMAGCTGNGDARTTSNLYAAAYHSAAAFAPGMPHFPPPSASYSPGGSAIFPPLVPPLVANGPGTTLSAGDGVSLNGASMGRASSFSRRSRLDPVSFLAGGCGMSSCMATFCNRSKRIDVIARITFPVAFTVFNIAYWTCYLKDAQL